MSKKHPLLIKFLKSYTAKEIANALEDCGRGLAFSVREELEDRRDELLRIEGINYESDWHYCNEQDGEDNE